VHKEVSYSHQEQKDPKEHGHLPQHGFFGHIHPGFHGEYAEKGEIGFDLDGQVGQNSGGGIASDVKGITHVEEEYAEGEEESFVDPPVWGGVDVVEKEEEEAEGATLVGVVKTDGIVEHDAEEECEEQQTEKAPVNKILFHAIVWPKYIFIKINAFSCGFIAAGAPFPFKMVQR
jgi:hypothetical protein